MKKNVKVTIALAVICGILAVIASFLAYGRNTNIDVSHDDHYGNVYDTPTLYFHGINGTKKLTNHLITFASRNNGTRALTINVDNNGKAEYKGKITHNTRNPLIQVNFLNNKAPIKDQVKWLTNILTYLKTKYHYYHYNAVGYYSGGVTVLETTALNAHNKNIPKLRKFISIAGPYNGVIGLNDHANENTVNRNGEPEIQHAANLWYPAYEQMLEDCKDFPKDVQILNIYGNINNYDNSDGKVSVSSAQSLKYLISKRVHNYHEIQINGQDAKHRNLPKNQAVNRIIISFLFSND